MHVYYVIHVLVGAETRYNPLKKNILRSARELMPYFQAHPIIVLITVPLWQVMHKPDLTGRMTKWVLELSEYEIDFQPLDAVQAQALADFVVENAMLTAMEPETQAQALDQKHAWVLYINGSAR